MTLQQLYNILQTLNLPVAYHHFESRQPLPFIVYLNDSDSTVGADNKVFYKEKHVDVEFYMAEKDEALEIQLETLLDNHEIFYEDPDEIFIEEEGVFKRTYYLTI